MSRAMRVLVALGFVAASAVGLSCNVNEYCLNCANGDGGTGDGGDDGIDGDPTIDAPDASPCVPSGTEVCDDKDNDCDGNIDEGALPTVGDLCDNQVGECAGGVKECTAGVIRCTKPPMAESCDNKDNDCDGTIDDGDPGGGAKCGTDVGECVAGSKHCMGGAIVCIGAIGGTMAPFGTTESCDAKDNDCDGMIDEMMSNLGACPTGTDVGECVQGVQACVGGGIICVGQVGPKLELCDNLDQDCDGNNTNGFDLDTDPTNCGTCGNVCNLMHAVDGCAVTVPNMPATCTIAACDQGFHNNDGMTANGCEFGPCTIQGNEVCNNIDDDCDGLTDALDPDMFTPPVATLCRTQNECSNAFVMCDGANGFTCVYPDPDVQQVNGVIQQETLCDGKDNDCDGIIDEGQPNLGNSCSLGQGECSTSGTMICDSANLNGPAVCDAAPPGAGTPEVCDGKDNDCNGIVDDDAANGDLPGQDWVTIPGTTTQIMKYEASRPDATNVLDGGLTTHVCSRQTVKPWTNLKYPQAVAACSSIGARLCTEDEWQRMCLPSTTYPVAGPATNNVTDFTFIEAEDAFANTTLSGAWTRIAPASFNGLAAMQVPDTGTSVTVAASALGSASRLDYQLTLANSTAYTMWLRMRSPTSTPPPPLGVHTAPTATLSPVSDATTAIGDLVIVTTWTVVTTGGVPVHTLNSAGGFVELTTRSANDGSNDGRLSVAYKVATAAGAVAYPAYSTAVGTSFSGITVIKAGAYGNLAQATANSTSNTTGGAEPDPSNLNISAPALVFAVGAYHYAGVATNPSPSAPTGFTKLWEVGTAQVGELVVGSQVVNTGNSINPAAFSNSGGTHTGSAAATVSIPLTVGSSRTAWVGLAAGTSAGNANATFVTTTNDDQWQWIASPTFTTTTSGTHTFSIYMREDGLMIDTIAVARQSTNTPLFDNAWAYESNPRTPQPQTCNDDDYDTDGNPANGDQDAILPTGTLPMCYANRGVNVTAFDMSGNVKEWALARAPGQNPLRGGASNNEVTGTTCKLDFSSGDDNFFFPNVGFRCCR